MKRQAARQSKVALARGSVSKPVRGNKGQECLPHLGRHSWLGHRERQAGKVEHIGSLEVSLSYSIGSLDLPQRRKSPKVQVLCLACSTGLLSALRPGAGPPAAGRPSHRQEEKEGQMVKNQVPAEMSSFYPGNDSFSGKAMQQILPTLVSKN